MLHNLNIHLGTLTTHDYDYWPRDPGRRMENDRTEYLVMEVWGPKEKGAFYMYVKWKLLSLHHLGKYQGNKQGILSQETLTEHLSLTWQNEC